MFMDGHADMKSTLHLSDEKMEMLSPTGRQLMPVGTYLADISIYVYNDVHNMQEDACSFSESVRASDELYHHWSLCPNELAGKQLTSARAYYCCCCMNRHTKECFSVWFMTAEQFEAFGLGNAVPLHNRPDTVLDMGTHNA